MRQERRLCKEKTTMEVHESPPDHSGKHHYFYTIDGKRFEASDEVQDARQLLQKAGRTFVLADPDIIEDTNLNRLVGGTRDDVMNGARKVDIARRVIKAVQPDADVYAVAG